MDSIPQIPRGHEFSAVQNAYLGGRWRVVRFLVAGALVGIALAFLGLSSDYRSGNRDTPGGATADWFGLRLRERAYTPDGPDSTPPFLYAFNDATGIALAGGVLALGAVVGSIGGITVGFAWSRRTERCTQVAGRPRA